MIGGEGGMKRMAGAAVPVRLGTYHGGLTVVRHICELRSTIEDKFNVLGERSAGEEGVKS